MRATCQVAPTHTAATSRGSATRVVVGDASTIHDHSDDHDRVHVTRVAARPPITTTDAAAVSRPVARQRCWIAPTSIDSATIRSMVAKKPRNCTTELSVTKRRIPNIRMSTPQPVVDTARGGARTAAM
ncbi:MULTISPECIES: hypothetical protein [Rhodococcus]|uniref:hypothetical protein n=1 Tax=Rhodococcus TaxID=1827 RepID=UPI001C3024BA|nr:MULTISPECIES: hypothetical protein [Rhodococcus]MBX4167295.1 hypothetical protein [Rhodococcus sp. DMU2021]